MADVITLGDRVCHPDHFPLACATVIAATYGTAQLFTDQDDACIEVSWDPTAAKAYSLPHHFEASELIRLQHDNPGYYPPFAD